MRFFVLCSIVHANQFFITMNTLLKNFHSHWNLIQHKYAEHVRWAEYREQNPNLPRQTNLEHSLSVQRLFALACSLLRASGRNLDFSLLMLAIQLHEDGEMFEGDTLWHDKTNDSHERELSAFIESVLPNIPEPLHELWRRAFLLQYAHDVTIYFSHQESCQDLKILRTTCAVEARIFDFLERLDYLLYAETAMREYGDVVLYVHVLRNQLSHFKQHLTEFPWFLKLLPESDMVEYEEFLKDYTDIPGPKDEGGIPAAYEYAKEQAYLG